MPARWWFAEWPHAQATAAQVGLCRSWLPYTGCMSGAPKPPTQLEIQPGESPWEALAREVAQRPNSPASLLIVSQVNQAMRPRTQAVDQLVEALEAWIEAPRSEAAEAAVTAAKAHWESACAAHLDDGLLSQFIADAEALIERRRRQPPRLEDVVEGVADRSDVGYQLGLDLGGLRGTWHRLWASLCAVDLLGEDSEGLVATVRAQFEAHLGRPLTQQEWSKLADHAKQHARRMQQQGLRGAAGESPTSG